MIIFYFCFSRWRIKPNPIQRLQKQQFSMKRILMKFWLLIYLAYPLQQQISCLKLKTIDSKSAYLFVVWALENNIVGNWDARGKFWFLLFHNSFITIEADRLSAYTNYLILDLGAYDYISAALIWSWDISVHWNILLIIEKGFCKKEIRLSLPTKPALRNLIFVNNLWYI